MENYTRADNNTREDHLHEIRIIDERQDKVGTIRMEEFSQLLGSQPREWQNRSPLMDLVPPEIRQKREHLFDPKVVSLGPYHHGKPELHRAEEFKYYCLDWCASGSVEKKCFFYSKVLEKIDEIRGCYAEASIVGKYDDKALAMMMLLDACFIVFFMDTFTGDDTNNFEAWISCVGTAATLSFTTRDTMLLENQIPLQVIKLIISLHYEKGDGLYLLDTFLNAINFNKQDKKFRIPGGDIDPPQHLLEAFWRVATQKPHNEANHESASKLVSKFRWPRFSVRGKKKDENAVHCYTCLSVTDLKAKGIHFRPCSSGSFKDIRFKSHLFHGEIQLPIRSVSGNTSVFLSNMIAYELSPYTKPTEHIVLFYTSFMKSLIASPADVKELQEKKILSNMLSSHEQVVKLYEEIDTFGFAYFGSINEIRQRIAEHCSSKAKTWIADLIHTRFESPWTVIALLAATFLLCLTFLQTYFTIHPAN